MSQTTQTQIEAMRALCQQLEKNTAVKTAHVDDWGRFGNFAIKVVPVEPSRTTTTRLKALVRKAIPKDAHLRQCFSPDPVIETRPGHFRQRRKVVGYANSSWTFDIDFQQYDAESNSFSQ